MHDTTMRKMPSVELLHELFELTPDGRLLRRTTHLDHKAGDEAGSVNRKGYRTVQFRAGHYRYYTAFTHHVVFAMTHGRWPTQRIDHINRNRLDNRPENLREVNAAQSAQNAEHRIGASGYRGVRWCRGHKKFKSAYTRFNKTVHLGYFDCPEFAALVRDVAVHRARGEYAVLNSTNC